MFQLPTAFLRFAAKIALLIYFVLALFILACRYWVLPNINQWREPIAAQLSAALDVDVQLGELRADWKGLNPSFDLKDVVITEPKRGSVLRLPIVHGRLSWRSLFSFEPQFIALAADGIDLSLRRDRHERLHFLGRVFDPQGLDSPSEGGRDAFLGWLLAQRHIGLQRSTIRWLDEFKAAPSLVFDDVTLVVENQGSKHLFSLTGRADKAVGGTLDVRGQFFSDTASNDRTPSRPAGRGELYFSVDDVHPAKWAAWLDLPPQLRMGQLASQSWLQFASGQLRQITSEVLIMGGNWSADKSVEIRAGEFRLFLDGSWDAYRKMTRGEGDRVGMVPAMNYRISARDLTALAPSVFENPVVVAELDANGAVSRDENGALGVQADSLRVLNKDVDATLTGSWRAGGSGDAGLAEIQGDVAWALIDAIDAYLPLDVDDDARAWMAKGLIGGKIHEARLTLSGDLSHFPFGEQPDKGDFMIEGGFSDAAIDYLPAEGKELGWPKLSDMDGRISLHRVDLNIQASHATMRPLPDKPIALSSVHARIANVEDDSVLEIQGNTAAQADAYLALSKHSPLGEMLDGLLDEARASGHWEVPLSLSIPLADSAKTAVKGEVRFSGGNVQPMFGMPPFSGVTGSLAFSENEISASGLKGEFLGGPVSVSGAVGGNAKGLSFKGRASAATLAKTVDLPGMKRLTGDAAYEASLEQSSTGAVSLAASTDMQGMGLDFPPPLGKAAATPLPVSATWRPHGKGDDMALQIAVGKDVEAMMLHDRKKSGGSYFHAGSVGVQQKLRLPAAGLVLDLRYPSVDLDAWQRIMQEFEPVPAETSGRAYKERVLMPHLSEFRLQSKAARVRGLSLDELTFTARQPAAHQWRVDISSTQTAGTLFWTEAQGKIAGKIDANFDRVALGVRDDDKSGETEEDTFQFDDELDVPAVNLRIKDLRLYGYPVGSLELVGVNQSRGDLWRLDELKLSSPHAALNGTGLWRLGGERRGLELDAVVTVTDFGAYFDQLGMKDVMKAGQGTITGKLEWHNMPWDFSKADLNGKIDFNLEKGRFGSVNSYSARLLELLSMQSVRRLARLDFNPRGLTKEGFPFDNLRGTIEMRQGVLSTRDYRVTGPVGTIVMDGIVNLNDEHMDLQAVVIPNLDVSGAAIAAGIAVNPIVGVGAFLAQWLLQAPLAKAMTVQYQVTGSLKDPKIQEVDGAHGAHGAADSAPAGGRKRGPAEAIAH